MRVRVVSHFNPTLPYSTVIVQGAGEVVRFFSRMANLAEVAQILGIVGSHAKR
jgi:hypothetical protein